MTVKDVLHLGVCQHAGLLSSVRENAAYGQIQGRLVDWSAESCSCGNLHWLSCSLPTQVFLLVTKQSNPKV